METFVEGIDKMAISDDKLFADPPPKEDCEICMLPMPYPYDHSPHSGAQPMYQSCCGKKLCHGVHIYIGR